MQSIYKQDSPTISVIIPCYNAHTHLGETIESIRNQTFKDYEIIIVDDGSTDPETKTYLDNLPNDILIIHQNNKGLPGARNTGIKEARGDLFLPLDCDDWLEPTFLEKSANLLKLATNNNFAYAYMKLEGEARGFLPKSYNFLEQLFTNQIPYCILMPKFIWEILGGYDESMIKGYEDWEFNIRLGINGYHGLVVQEPLFHYRVSSDGMLKRISIYAHLDLWKYIQKKHQRVFTFFSLFKIWKVWHKTPSSYPFPILLVWWLITEFMPNRFSNALLKFWLNFYSHARRSERTLDR
jgi:glycosyltransferase involved in cell wall biosynthesis